MADHLVLVNDAARAADEEAAAAAVAVLRGAGEAELVATRSVADVDDALDRLGDRRLVVCGGDGSLHLALDRLRRAGLLGAAELGLVPLGTGNDLARGLGVPLRDPAAAAERILTGRSRRLDLLVDDRGAICVNALHAGVGADAAARADGLKGLLGEAAYPVGSVAAGAVATGARARLRVDDRPWVDDEVLLVAVCNGPTIGGGAALAAGADPGDGWLDVVAVTATGPVARVGFGRALQAGRAGEREDVRTVRGRRVTITGPLRYDVDGEIEPAAVDERSWWVRPGAWRLRH